MPVEMYKIGSIGEGFVAIMARPSLEADAAASIINIARLGIQQVVSLLEPTEARNLGLYSEREQVKAHGMGFISFPIPDMGLPPSVEDYAQLSKKLFNQVNTGVNTLIHCHAGIGRSGLLVAGILLHCDMDPQQAFAYASKMRGVRVPETPEQEQWLSANYASILDIDNGQQ
jgi:protein-tyrosine phosphatase